MQQVYKKNSSAKMDEEFSGARQFGAVKVGTEHIFWKKFLKWMYIPAAEIKQVYRQIQQVESHTSCCEVDCSIQRLQMILADDSELSVTIGDCFFRQEPEMMMDNIAAHFPQILQKAPKYNKRA